MQTEFGRTMSFPRRLGFLGTVLVVVALFVLLFAGPFRTVTDGPVGVKDFFGLVASDVLPGIRVVSPTRVEVAGPDAGGQGATDVPSKEGLLLSETSPCFSSILKAAEITRPSAANTSERSSSHSSGRRFGRSRHRMKPRRDSAEREKIAGEIFELFRRIAGPAAFRCSRFYCARLVCRRLSRTRFRRS
jgi:hypothetical protein